LVLHSRRGEPQEALSYCDRAVVLSEGKAKDQAKRPRALRRLGQLGEAGVIQGGDSSRPAQAV